METVRYTKIFLEDLALGRGTRLIRLANGANVLLSEIHMGQFLSQSLSAIVAADGQGVLTLSGLVPAGGRIMGVTVEVLEEFGDSNGLESILIGTGVQADHWGEIDILLGSVTTTADFRSSDMPIVPAGGLDILLTATGGAFDTAGRAQVTAYALFL